MVRGRQHRISVLQQFSCGLWRKRHLFVNSTVLGVGAGTTLTGNSGADSFDFGTYSLTGVQLFGNQDNDTIRLTGQVVDSSIYGGKGEDSIQLRNTLTNAYIEANSGNDTVNITAGVTGTYLHGGQGEDRFSVTGTVSNSTLVGGSGADLLTFNNRVDGSSIAGASDGGTADTANDTIVF